MRFSSLLYHLLSVMVAFVYLTGTSQAQKLTLEDIWQKNTYAQKSVYGVRWMNKGTFYTTLVTAADGRSAVVKNDVWTGRTVDTLFQSSLLPKIQGKPITFGSYILSPNEEWLLLETASEQVYRRSSRATYYVANLKTKSVQPLSGKGKQSNVQFSPGSTHVSFTRDNNLFVAALATKEELTVTTTGKTNEVIHGSTDWVYEEEFSFTTAYVWSPDNRRLAYLTFDERQVPEFNMQLWKGLYPQDYRYKYPKAGEPNAVVTASVFDVTSGSTVEVPLPQDTEYYLPRLNWTSDPQVFALRKMNRLQNTLELLHVQAATGAYTVAYREESPTYLDVFDDLYYLSDGKGFLYSSERSGFRHLYQYTMQGKLVKAITEGVWEIDDVAGVDEINGWVYYTSTEQSTTGRQFYAVSLKSKAKKVLSAETGSHSVSLSNDFGYYLNYHSTLTQPLTVTLRDTRTGKVLKVLEDNNALKEKLQALPLGKVSFEQVPAADGSMLNSYRIYPPDFNPDARYPVLMHVYGGPGSQQVRDSWAGGNYLWHHMLAQMGYIIVVADNRGTGGRGEQFKKMTYRKLGKLETDDQISVARYLGKQPYVESTRIGIWGWSYGGYMSSLSLMIGADYFKSAIAVAPVTNWRLYDSIYTERFLGLPSDNTEGYDLYSPQTHTGKLKGNLLLVHGTGDDNVHFQNAVQLTEALVKSGKQFDSFFYPDRNHGIYGGNTRLHLYTMMTRWLERNL
jgi:dipeptidyl-peptidase-4